MKKEEGSMDDSEDWVEAQIKHGGAMLSVGECNWSDDIETRSRESKGDDIEQSADRFEDSTE